MVRPFTIMALLFAPVAMADTHSHQYQWLETDSLQRLQFIRAQNHKLNQKIEASSNYQPVKRWLKQTLDVETVLKTIELDKTHSVKLIQRGLGKPTELVFAGPRSQEVLFSNNALKRNNSFNIIDFGISPDGHHLSLIVEHDGSLDDMQGIIYDLPNRKMLPVQLSLYENGLAWMSSTSLAYIAAQEDGSSALVTYDLSTGQTTVIDEGEVISEKTDDVLYYAGGSYHLKSKMDGKDLEVAKVRPRSIATHDSRYVYLLCDGPNRWEKSAVSATTTMRRQMER